MLIGLCVSSGEPGTPLGRFLPLCAQKKEEEEEWIAAGSCAAEAADINK